jgi:hypothetical protein
MHQCKSCPIDALQAQIRALRLERERMEIIIKARDRELNTLTKERREYRQPGYKGKKP